MDRRRQIRMDGAELAAFLDAQQTLTCATLGPSGRPHLAALWYVPVDGRLDCWTYAASQKARNLERDPRATLLTEAGTAYQELRGVSMECDADLVRDPERVLDIMQSVDSPALRIAWDNANFVQVGVKPHTEGYATDPEDMR